MRKFTTALVLALAFVMGGMVFATADAADRVPAKVCKTLLDSPGADKRQCKRQGWYYGKGTSVGIAGSVITWELVLSPSGRIVFATRNQQIPA